MSALGGRWRDLYATGWLVPFVWNHFDRIRNRARESGLTLKEAMVEAGVPAELYDETYALTQAAQEQGLAPADFPQCQALFARYEQLGFRNAGKSGTARPS